MFEMLYLKNKHYGRIEWLDVAKGLGIILVMLHHYWNSEDWNWFFVWIVSFHMPLFFICSGYSFSNKKNVRDYVAHKLRTVIVPYFCLGLLIQVFVVFKDYVKHEYEVGDFFERCSNLLVQRHWEILWFMPTLFLTEVIYKVIYTLLEGNMKKISLVFVSFLLIAAWYYEKVNSFLPWCLDIVLVSSALFFVGHFMAQMKMLEKNSKFRTILSLFINIISMYVNYIIFGEATSMMGNQYGVLPLGIIAGVSGSIFIMSIAQYIDLSFLKYIGKNSLLIYAWHVQIIWTIEEALFKLFNIYQTELNVMERCGKVVMQILFAIVVLTFCNEIIRNTRLRVILGMKEGETR